MDLFRISRWRAWAPGVTTAADWSAWLAGKPADDNAQADVSQLPALLRRRLDRLGRMALHTAWPCLEGLDAVELVFASRDGSLPRTLELLAALVHDEPLSPTLFSVSVHNGTAGLYSMARADHSPTTAVAAGPDSLVMGLLEAASLIATGSARVLMCYADQSLPPPYDRAPGRGSNNRPLSISLLLEPAAGEAECFQLTPARHAAAEAPAAALLRLLLERRSDADIGVEQRWHLERISGARQA